VRTRGWGGSRGSGSDGRSWLLIKHRDDWSGAVDIAEFAPLSVKSEGDFADILSQDDPDVWRSNRPAEGGDTGALFKRIISRAIELREARVSEKRGARTPAAARPATAKRERARRPAAARTPKPSRRA
jgi:hypothetical protein